MTAEILLAIAALCGPVIPGSGNGTDVLQCQKYYSACVDARQKNTPAEPLGVSLNGCLKAKQQLGGGK